MHRDAKALSQSDAVSQPRKMDRRWNVSRMCRPGIVRFDVPFINIYGPFCPFAEEKHDNDDSDARRVSFRFAFGGRGFAIVSAGSESVCVFQVVRR